MISDDICDIRSVRKLGSRACFQTSNYTPRASIHFKNCSLNNFFHQVALRTRGIALEGGTTMPSSPIESSRTMVLVTKATRCHRPWISVVVEVCWGSGWWKGWKRGREEKLSLLAYIRFVYRCCSSKHMVRRRAPSLRLKIYIPSNTLTDRKSASSSTSIIDASLATNQTRESSSSFSTRGHIRTPR